MSQPFQRPNKKHRGRSRSDNNTSAADRIVGGLPLNEPPSCAAFTLVVLAVIAFVGYGMYWGFSRYVSGRATIPSYIQQFMSSDESA